MKLKKGSLEAKKFMAKIRAKKGKSKKISGVKKPSVKKTHTDIKSHNYKISISGNKSKEFIETRKKINKVNQELEDLNFDITMLNKQINETKKIINKKPLQQAKRDFQKQYIALKKYLKTLKYYI